MKAKPRFPIPKPLHLCGTPDSADPHRIYLGSRIVTSKKPTGCACYRRKLSASRKATQKARLAHRCSEATIFAVISRIGGFVEGNPTCRINFLQRLDALVDSENSLREFVAKQPCQFRKNPCMAGGFVQCDPCRIRFENAERKKLRGRK